MPIELTKQELVFLVTLVEQSRATGIDTMRALIALDEKLKEARDAEDQEERESDPPALHKEGTSDGEEDAKEDEG